MKTRSFISENPLSINEDKEFSESDYLFRACDSLIVEGENKWQQ